MDPNSAAIQQAYAAWVQATGSIVAIIAAIWIASRQARADRRLRVDEMRDRLESLWTMIDTCCVRIEAVRANAMSAPAMAGAKRLDDDLVTSARTSIQLVSTLPAETVPSAKAAEALVRTRIAIANAVAIDIIPTPGIVFAASHERDLAALRDELRAAANILREDIDMRK